MANLRLTHHFLFYKCFFKTLILNFVNNILNNNPIKLNQNESPYDLPEKIKDEILIRLRAKKWNIYPDFIPDEIYEKVAKNYNLNKSNILIGNGSNEMIFTILAATIEKGKKLVIPQPTFTVYELIASNLNANIKHVMLKNDFSFDVDKIISEAKDLGSLTILCSPNSPTGTYLSYNDIKKIIKESAGIVVVDEAYIQFGGESAINLINENLNLIILRTFSKAYGLAGLRIGMMIANEKLIAQLSKVKLPYNLNIFSLITLDVIFDNMKTINKHVEMILQEKKLLKKKLSDFKELTIIPSATNFFLIKVKNSKWLYEQLLKFGILVRDVSSYPMLDNCLRISVGSKNDNEVLIDSLRKIYTK